MDQYSVDRRGGTRKKETDLSESKQGEQKVLPQPRRLCGSELLLLLSFRVDSESGSPERKDKRDF